MAANRLRLILMGAAILLLACGMAALGMSDPRWAELPWALGVEPAFAAGIVVLVFVVSLASPRLGIFAALVCATPMFMFVGAPPAGIIGATIFFLLWAAIGMIGFAAAVAMRAAARRLRR
jgi:hypothetical protein